MSEDLFSPENKAKSNFVKWTTIGQSVSGTYVEKKIRPNLLKPGTEQTVYTIVQDDGVVIFVSGRQGDPAVLSGLENAKFGQYVGIRYEGDKPASKPGMNAAKMIVVYAPVGQNKPEVLAAFRGEGLTVEEPEVPEME